LESETYGRIKLSYAVLDMKVVALRTVAREVRGEWRYTVLLYEGEGERGERRLWKGERGGCVDRTLWEHENSLKVDENCSKKLRLAMVRRISFFP
jgi:hypothetical protein